MNYYELLEVSPNASQEMIKIAYKTLARKYHPDVCTYEKAGELMQKINEAYSVLSDENKRAEYDSKNSFTQRTYTNTTQSSNSTEYAKPKQTRHTENDYTVFDNSNFTDSYLATPFLSKVPIIITIAAVIFSIILKANGSM